MGGYGSGRGIPSRFRRVEDCAVLDAHAIVRQARAERRTGVPKDIEANGQRITFVATPGTLGGRVWWLVCRCGQRFRKLYRSRVHAGFACRSCHHLRYKSQRLSRWERLSRRAEKIVARLGGVDEASGLVLKPKGMHWRTFHRLMDRHDAFDRASFACCLAVAPVGLRRHLGLA